MTNKKSIHRFTEKQRRKDMKELYCSLRSLLPEEYLMGKRSTAEQISGTAMYIKDLQRRLNELTQQRDETRKEKACEALQVSVAPEIFPAVKIHSLGLGVLISTNTFNSRIVFSDLLLTVERNGLDISSVSSSAINDKVFHTIYAKVPELHSFDSRTLYQKIWNLIGENSSIVDA